MKGNEVNGKEKNAKAANDPIQNPQCIFQYKIQSIVSNTFTNKESVAHLFIINWTFLFTPPQLLRGEGGWLLITSPH